MSLYFTQAFRKGGTEVSAHLHRLKSVKASSPRQEAWVTFKDDEDNIVSLHVDYRLAEALQEAFDEYENWLSGQEGPTYDDALAAKVSATVRESQARALK